MRSSFTAALQEFGVWLIRRGRPNQSYTAESFRDLLLSSPDDAGPFEGDESLVLVTADNVAKKVSISTLKQWILGKYNLSAVSVTLNSPLVGIAVDVVVDVFTATNIAVGLPVIGSGVLEQV